MVIHLRALKSGNQMVYGCELCLQSRCGACHRKGDDRSMCVCASLINRLTTMWTWLFFVKTSLCFPLICCVYPSELFTEVVMRSLTQHAHLPQTVWFSGTNEGRMLVPLLCVCVWCCPVLAGACFSSSDWGWMRTAELATSGSPLSAGAALWWTPEWWFPQRRTRTKLSWGALRLTWVINAG